MEQKLLTGEAVAEKLTEMTEHDELPWQEIVAREKLAGYIVTHKMVTFTLHYHLDGMKKLSVNSVEVESGVGYTGAACMRKLDQSISSFLSRKSARDRFLQLSIAIEAADIALQGK